MNKKAGGKRKDTGKLEAKVIAEFYAEKYRKKAVIKDIGNDKYEITCGKFKEAFTKNDLWKNPHGIIFIKYFQAAVEEKDEGIYYHFPIPEEVYKKISEQPD